MKTRLLLGLFLFLFSFASAQKEAAIWYFGEKAGIDFNSGSPVALSDGELQTNEGCAVISNAMGQLLFYTDGITVYNREHKVMLNGNGLKGHHSSTNSAIIVQKPNDPQIYFIFTTDSEFGSNGLRFSQVDMSLDNNLGGITSMKNVLLETPVAEKLTAIEIPEEDAYWVLTHGAHNNEFLAYKVSAQGVHKNPVRSKVGPVVTFPAENAQGQIKISPDGKKVGIASRGTGFELYDFDAVTGKVSNYRQLASDYNAAYGIEFSPNSEFLYTGSNNTGLIQYDLNAGSTNEMIDSRITIVDDNWLVWALQLAIDGKIYVATSRTKYSGAQYIDVISKPNSLGADSDYRRQVLYLDGRTAQLGLPPFMQSFFHSNQISAENFCAGNETSFSIALDVPVTNITWHFGDGTTSSLENPVHTYLNPGDYEVKVTVDAGGEVDHQTMKITIFQTPEVQEPDDVVLCLDQIESAFDLSSLTSEILGNELQADFDVNYFSSISDAENNINPLPNMHDIGPGEEQLYVRISNKQNPGCYDIKDFRFIVWDTPVLNSIQDWLVCVPEANFVFDLSQKNHEILAGQSEDNLSVSYFETQQDAEENNNPVTGVDLSTSDPAKKIFFRIGTIPQTSCFQIGSFDLEVARGFVTKDPDDQFACDEGDGYGSFDTSLWTSNVLGKQTGFNVSFFTNKGEPLPNPLPATFRNSTPHLEKIVARVENEKNAMCFSETTFDLVVNPGRELLLQETYMLCDFETHLELELPDTFDTWEWEYEDGSIISSTSKALLTAEGVYTITVGTLKNGVLCEEVYSLSLLQSHAPSITGVNTRDRSGQNFIEIIASGDGDLEYSIDGINYQESNHFPDLPGGTYTVYVKDSNGCGIATYEVVLTGYPEFFTPNDDGYNDRWQLERTPGSQERPVYIFDRYGKLLKQMSSHSTGWDGTYNGKLMPPDDYWFSTEVEGKPLKGHFTLMR